MRVANDWHRREVISSGVVGSELASTINILPHIAYFNKKVKFSEKPMEWKGIFGPSAFRDKKAKNLHITKDGFYY